MNRMLIVIFATLSAFGQRATAQPKLTEGVRMLRAYYGDKRLPIGTHVWANIGDNYCSVPAIHDGWNHRPDVSPRCFDPSPDPKYRRQTWYRAKIAGYASATWTGKVIPLYEVEFLPPPKDGKDHANEGWFVSGAPEYGPLTRNAVVEGEAYKMINVFDKRSEWSLYVITLNW